MVDTIVTTDYIVIAIYFVAVVCVGIWVGS